MFSTIRESDMRYLPLLALLLLLAAGCRKMPSNVIRQDKMASLLADLHTAGAVVEIEGASWNTDSSRHQLREAIYSRHGVSSEDVDSSLMWYGHNLNEYLKVYDKTLTIIDKRIAEAERAGAKTVETNARVTLDGDSVNLWQGPLSIRLNEKNPSEFITFSYAADRFWERGDHFTLSLTPVATQSPVYLTIVAQYGDGTAEYVTNQSIGDSRRHLTLVVDSTKMVSGIFGSIHYSPSPGEISYLDSITLVRTRTHDDNVVARRRQHTVKLRQ